MQGLSRNRGLVIAAALVLTMLCPQVADAARPKRVAPRGKGLLATEKLPGKGVWVDPFLVERLEKAPRVRATVWLDEQLLGDGQAYRRRAREFARRRRGELRKAAVATLRALSDRAYEKLAGKLDKLRDGGGVRALERHWIVNGFSCGVTKAGLEALAELPGVRKIFATRGGMPGPRPAEPRPPAFGVVTRPAFDPDRYQHPWYVRQLLADRVWRDLGATGRGTLNVVHDWNFVFTEHLTGNLHRNPKEIPANGKDDDGNGLVDDCHGYNFSHDTAALTVAPVAPEGTDGSKMHGFMCAAIICGAGTEKSPYELGIAPEGRWAGVIARRQLEVAIEWAIDQGADTYSMSFSIPNQGEYRSHRRKVMEHGALCGVCFVSGAGNFAQSQKIPVQMRQPEDIPYVVFSAAGVQRDLGRTAFSSQGPVEWETEHYQDGTVLKPEVCCFNANLPLLRLDGRVQQGGLGGNSFAGPMLCGAIALMLSADPDCLPWDVRQILMETAMDVAAEGFDGQTGHGLVNCYRAVKEVLRRKAKREGKPTRRYTGREPGDVLDVEALAAQVEVVAVVVMGLGDKGQAKALGVQVGDRLVSYGGTPIRSRADIRKAKKAARDAGVEQVPVVLQRGEETLELTFKPGQLGIQAGERYKEPVFR